jgi:hypothetical protein
MQPGQQAESMAYHPDLKEVEKEKGLFCFVTPERVCGPACMAYQVAVPEGQDYLAQQWAHCMLLTNMHKIGKHTTVIATELVRKNRDAARTGQQPPPLPTMPRKP